MIVFVYDLADFFRDKIPGSAKNVADHLPAFLQRGRVELLRTQPVRQVLPAVLIGYIRIPLEFVVPQLGQEFKKVNSLQVLKQINKHDDIDYGLANDFIS